MSLIHLSCAPLDGFSSQVAELRLRVSGSRLDGVDTLLPALPQSLLMTAAIKFRQNT